MEFGLLWAAVAAIAVGFAAVELLARGARGALLRDQRESAIGAAFVGVAIGRLAAMLLGGTNPLSHPADILIVRGGVEPLFAGPAAFMAYLALRRDRRALGHREVGVGVLAALAGWEAACLLRGTCLGDMTTLPWGWAATGGGEPRHPVGLYAALGMTAAAVALWRLRLPASLLWGGVAAAGVRALVEPWRAGLTPTRTWWYLAFAVSGSAMAVLLDRRGEQDSREPATA